jgi:MoaA/NifB/PqqE/SkfB family radical SAM enzyme
MFGGTASPNVYRSAAAFQALHDPNQFEGRCGYCEYHALCSGSRVRAYDATGNPFKKPPRNSLVGNCLRVVDFCELF